MQYDVGRYLTEFADAPVHLNVANNDKVAVIVETRDCFFLPLVIKNFCSLLGNSWNVHLFVTPAALSLVQKQCEGFKFAVTLLDVKGRFGPVEYSRLLRSQEFWGSIAEETVLLFQVDSAILRPVPEWALTFDVIGAPCGVLKESEFIHNGGCSIRSKSAMLRVLAHSPDLDDRPEDVFFTQEMRSMNARQPVFKLADMQESAMFSAESIAVRTCIVVHGTDKYYLPGDVLRELVTSRK